MKDMKMSPAERTDQATPILSEQTYPYGLRINLDDESLTKLGITELPAVGSTMIIVANVKVMDVSANESTEGTRRNVGLQITEMEVSAAKEEEQGEGQSSENTVRKLYGDQNTVMAPPNAQLYH